MTGRELGPHGRLGYDLGMTKASTIRADWQGRVPDAMLEVLVGCSGASGLAGKAPTSSRLTASVLW